MKKIKFVKTVGFWVVLILRCVFYCLNILIYEIITRPKKFIFIFILTISFTTRHLNIYLRRIIKSQEWRPN